MSDEKSSNKGVLVTESGCVVHRAVEALEFKTHQSVWICRDCNKEIVEEEEHGGG